MTKMNMNLAARSLSGHVRSVREIAAFVALIILALDCTAHAELPLRQRLKTTGYQIAYECYVDGNWEIFVSSADGSSATNLTRTLDQNEHYPQVSPDGTKICY